MVSTDSVVESDISAQSKALAESSEAFTTRAEARGWIGASRSWMDIATGIFGGESGDDAAAGSYAGRVGATEDAPASVFEAIRSDADSALSAFSDVQQQADRLLESGTVERFDITHFEQALVTAQKSYRGFSKATGLAAQRGRTGLKEAEQSLDAFAAAIDTARDTADTLADAYAARDRDTARDTASS